MSRVPAVTTTTLSTLAPTLALVATALSGSAHAEALLGEGPALGPLAQRTTQAQIESGSMSLEEVRRAGLTVFAIPFNRVDGFGDGPMDPLDTTSPGGRPTLQGNGMFLRVNGLDAQSCLECHSLLSAATVPATLGVGGAGGMNTSPIFQARYIDVEDAGGNGFAALDGRVINTPALFGTGAVQQLAKEMTARLQRLRNRALAHPGTPVALQAKGVAFGHIVADANGDLDTSLVEGIDADLVVRPFGRKGGFTSVRQFSVGALMFHMGMQPVEAVGAGVDPDGDGVTDEVMVGEASALEIFVTTQERPFQELPGKDQRRGLRLFRDLGCAGCHRPTMHTQSPILTYSFPEVDTDPEANVFYAVDLRDAPMHFEGNRRGGVRVAMFSDLKRHDMGPGLAEDFHLASERQNREFITAKLWGVADTAPYLHDGRALTLNAAITQHGGEAQAARDAYAALAVSERNAVLALLRSLRNPVNPNQDVLGP